MASPMTPHIGRPLLEGGVAGVGAVMQGTGLNGGGPGVRDLAGAGGCPMHHCMGPRSWNENVGVVPPPRVDWPWPARSPRHLYAVRG